MGSPGWRRTSAACLAAALSAMVAGLLLVRVGPLPAAAMRIGGEEAFATTRLYPRELPPGGAPLRWTGPQVRVAFARLPALPLTLEVGLPGRRGAALVSEGGRILGRLEPGERAASYALAAGSARREIEIAIEPFAAGDGRTLGAQLERVGLRWRRDQARPDASLVVLVALAGLGVATGLARSAGGGWAPLGAVGGVAVVTALLWPAGLAFSSAAPWLAGSVALLGIVAGELGRRSGGSRNVDAGAIAAALFLVGAVFGPLTTSPVMVVSDAVFQANKLVQVANGDLFPVSVTQHRPPFEFPYGVAFFALLAPLIRAGFDPVSLVRVGAAMATVVAAFAWVLALVPSGPRAAALAGVVLAAMPITFDVFSYGNLANAFAQACTLGLLAWWVAATPGGLSVGGLLAAGAGLAHLSGALCLVPLAAVLAFADRLAGPKRLTALAAGVAVSVLYYASFAPMVLGQVGRLADGAGGSAGVGIVAGLVAQAAAVIAQWGLPALVLALFGDLPPRDSHAGAVVRASLLAGALLAVTAALTPLQPRYLYALTGVIALMAGRGALALARRGRAGAWTAAALIALAVLRGGANLVEALVARYRPG